MAQPPPAPPAAPAIAPQWHYMTDAGPQGPISTERLTELLQTGQAHPDSFVWRAGMAQWQPASTCLGNAPGPVALGYLSPDQGPPPPPEGDLFARMIPTNNVPALIGYYLGVFSAMPFLGLPLGIAAIVLGILGLKRVRRFPDARGKGHAITALVCGMVFTLLWGGLIALIAMWM